MNCVVGLIIGVETVIVPFVDGCITLTLAGEYVEAVDIPDDAVTDAGVVIGVLLPDVGIAVGVSEARVPVRL